VSLTREALEYNVAADGTVSTNGVYRVISEREWATWPEYRSVMATRFGPLLEAVRTGQIIALPVRDHKHAWGKARSLQDAAKRVGVRIETKRATDPAQPDQMLLLVRAAAGV
jgi:hypothetical protein